MSLHYGLLLLIFWIVVGTARAADEAPGKPLYSLEPGVRWSYDETKEILEIVGQNTNVMRVIGTMDEEIRQAPPRFAEKGKVVFSWSVFKEEYCVREQPVALSGGYAELLEWRQNDLYLHGVRVWVDGLYSEAINEYQPPLLFLKSAARPGTSWTVGTQKNMGVDMPTMATLEGTETVTVPAGTFTNCLKVTYTVSGMSGVTEMPTGTIQVENGDIRDTVWYAQGVGVVKDVQVKTSTSRTNKVRQFNREEQTKLLRSYAPAK